VISGAFMLPFLFLALFPLFLAQLEITLRFIIPHDGMRENWRMNADSAGAAEKEIIIP
jgi:hypothetical protein